MKKKHIAPSLLASFLAILPLTLHAEDCCMPSYQPGEPLCEDEVCTMYPAFAGVKISCGFDMYGYGEFLYWAPVTSASFVATTFEGTPLGITQNELVHKYGYRPAFRVGFGAVMHDMDEWTSEFEYTWYHHFFKKNFSIAGPNTLSSTLKGVFNNAIYSNIRDTLHVGYDIVSMNFGRPNYLGQKVIFSPYSSFIWLKRNLVISQDLRRSGTNLIDEQHSKYKYSAIGLGAGVQTDWLLCWGVRLIGKTDFGLLYPYSRKVRQHARTAEGIRSRLKIPNKFLVGTSRSKLGVGWGKYLCCEQYHVDVSATFDLVGDIAHTDFNAGMFDKALTMLFGWTLQGKFDF